MQANYSFPLRCGDMMKKGRGHHPKCSLEESVRQHICIILITRFGENRYDTSYGCEVWEHDWESVKVLDGKKHDFENSIKILLEKHEPRLADRSVKVEITEVPVVSHLKTERRQKKRIEIKIKGKLAETNQPFDQEPFVIFFTPVTTDAFFTKK